LEEIRSLRNDYALKGYISIQMDHIFALVSFWTMHDNDFISPSGMIAPTLLDVVVILDAIVLTILFY